jgi:hypothetical protein
VILENNIIVGYNTGIFVDHRAQPGFSLIRNNLIISTNPGNEVELEGPPTKIVDTNNLKGSAYATNLFINAAAGDYRLHASSEARGHGRAGSGSGTDIMGTTIQSTPDIGAYQYCASGCATPPTTSVITIASTLPSSGAAITVSPTDNAAQGSGTTPFTRTYDNGTTITFTAAPSAGGNNFTSWSNCDTVVLATRVCTIRPSVGRTIIANYGVPPAIMTLTVASENPNSGVDIAVTPNDNVARGDGTTPFTRSYPSITTVTLTAPSTSSGGANAFNAWIGCDVANGTDCTVSMEVNKTVTAQYGIGTTPGCGVSKNFADGDGIVICPGSPLNIRGDPTDPDDPGVGTHAPGDTGNIVGGPIVGVVGNVFYYVNFATDPDGYLTNKNIILTGGSSNYNLTINSVNPASGIAVTVTPVGNNGLGDCPSTPCIRNFNAGTSVVLTAPATNNGNPLVWIGCTSTTSNRCTKTLSATATVTASYNVTSPICGIEKTFVIGTNVTVCSGPLNILNSAAGLPGTYIGQQAMGALGHIVGGPTVGTNGTSYVQTQYNQNHSDPQGTPTNIGWTTTRNLVPIDAQGTLIFTLSVASSPNGAAIVVTPVDDNTADNGTTPFNRVWTRTPFDVVNVTLTAPATASSLPFRSWTGCTTVDGTGNRVCHVSLNSSRTVTANYAAGTTIGIGGAAGVKAAPTATIKIGP